MAEGAKDEENKPPKSLSFPALGRNAQLGDLYDAKTDTFIPGVNLFKTELKLDDHYKELTKNSVDIRYSQTDTLQQKLDLLDVKGEMRLTIGAAGHKIEGSAAYLNKQKESSREENLTLLTKAITKYQYIPDIKQLKKNVTDNDTTNNLEATHVVVGVTWGGSMCVTFKHSNANKASNSLIEGSLSLKFDAGAVKLERCTVSGKKQASQKEVNSEITFVAACDVYDLGKNIPKTMKEAVNIANELPKLLGDSKGVPIHYTLLSYDIIRELMQDKSAINSKLVSIKEGIIEQCLEKLEHAMSLYQRLNDLYMDVMANQVLFSIDKQKEVYEVISKYQSHLNITKSDFVEKLTEVRNGRNGEKEDILVKLLTAAFDEKDVFPKKTLHDEKTLIGGAYAYLSDWRVEITQKINYMSIFNELKRDVIVATDSFPIRITKKMQAHIVVFYFSTYRDILKSGEPGFRMMYEFHNACKKIDKANSIDSDEPPLGDYLIIDGELQPDVKTFLCEPKDGEVRVVYFTDNGIADVKEWNNSLGKAIMDRKGNLETKKNEEKRKHDEEKRKHDEEKRKQDEEKRRKQYEEQFENYERLSKYEKAYPPILDE